MKALTQVILRLRANAFDMDHGLVLLPTSFPYMSQVTESSNKPRYAKRHGSKDHDYSKLVRTGPQDLRISNVICSSINQRYSTKSDI